MDEIPSFGAWLRRRRKALDLTQEALARRVGYSVSAIRKLEADEYRPSREIAEHLADALAIAPQERAAFVHFARVGLDAEGTSVRLPTAASPMPLTPACAPAAVAPSRTRDTHPTNLPPQPTPFIGREEELALIATHLHNPACRLVTVIGPGGIGKTRLALEAAAGLRPDFPDGVYFVALAALSSGSLLVSTIADALAFPLYGGADPEAQLLSFLHERRMLLVLDNFEHLLEGTRLLAQILDYAPGVKLLVTSRERLNLLEEWLIPLRGLDFPRDDGAADAVAQYSAVRLFVQRAAQVQPAFGFSAAVQPRCCVSAGWWKGCRWGSSWPRRGRGCCPARRSPQKSPKRSIFWRHRCGTCRRGSAACERPSNIPGRCWRTTSGRSSRGWRSSAAASGARRPKA